MTTENNEVERSFFGYCNGKKKKLECARFPREYTEEITIPVKKNGAIICGQNLVKDGGNTVLKPNLYDGKCLVIFDFDVKPNVKFGLKDIPEACRYTFLVRTGGGGIHAYFWCKDVIRNSAHKNVRNKEKLAGFDIRGEGGLAFAVGSDFSAQEESHTQAYSILKNFDIKTITLEEADRIKSEIIKPQVILRKGFQMIIDGDIWITHGAQKQTGIAEHKYWSALFREIYSQGGNPQDYYDDLAKNQPEFDAKVSDYQWKYMVTHDINSPNKRPSNIFYNRLFEPWDTRRVVEEDTTENTNQPWYVDFDAFWHDIHSESIKWIYETKQWVRYEKGVYVPIPSEEIERIIILYFTQEQLPRRIPMINLAVRTIQANYHTSLKDYDRLKQVLNVKNGLLNLETKELVPHNPKHLSLIQLPLYYKEKAEKTPYWDRIKKSYPDQMEKIETFIQAIIFGDMSNELLVFIYGPTGSGKGTMLSVIKDMFKGVCSFQPLERIGSAFGLSPLVGKLLNLNLEMTISNIDAGTMQILKSIVGRDEDLTVNIKHVREFPYKFDRMFFISATNQLPALASTDIAAWFRRVLLINFNKTQLRDTEMKDGIREEVHDVFTRLVQMEYEPLINTGTDMTAFVNMNEMEWIYSADPVQHICEALFKKSTNAFATERVDDCVNWVSRRLNEEKFGNVPFRKLKQKVIDILASMQIVVVRKDGTLQFKYIDVIDPAIRELREEQIKEDLKSKDINDISELGFGQSFNEKSYKKEREASDWEKEFGI